MDDSHADVIGELEEHFRPILENSPDGIYLWLDDAHTICNEKLAAMFGYSVDEWRRQAPFLDRFVVEEDQVLFSWNYHHRVAALAFPVTFRFRGVRKDGSTFTAETDMIPITYAGHAVAYHFVRRVGE